MTSLEITKVTARINLRRLRENSYPGRGIVIGLDESGQCLIQVYWIMGRSENSRNRVFTYDEERLLVRTEAADPAKVRNPHLIFYNAMAFYSDHHIVSNGDQTDTIGDFLAHRGDFRSALMTRQYEPDAPNFTPRISAICSQGDAVSEMSIIRKSPWGEGADRHFYVFEELGRGYGYCLTTYKGDGDPLPAFRGEPYILPLFGNMEAVATTLWGALNPENRVSLVVKFIPFPSGTSDVYIINRYEKVAAK